METGTPAPATESAPAETTAPQSTADIAASVIQSAENADTSEMTESAEAGPSITPADSTPEVVTQPTIEELSEAAKFLLGEGHKAKKDDGREPWFRYKTVEKMLDRYANQHKTTWDGARTTLEAQANELRTHLDEVRADVMGDPMAFLQKLASVDPRYRAFLTPQQATQIAEKAQAISEKMPEPDLPLADGSRTYSLEGIQKLLDWKTAQVEKGLLSKVDERLKPLTEREQRAEQQAQLAERTRQTMTEARNWPGFTDHEADILKALQEDSAKAQAERRRPSLSLEAAYRQVVIPKLSTDRNKIREELLKEISAAPKSTSVPRSGVEPTRQPGPKTTADIARQVIAQAEAQR